MANWVAAAKTGGDKPAPGARTVSELEAENAKLRKELAEARLECARPGVRTQPPASGLDGRYKVYPTEEGWLYLAALKDVFSCEIVS